ncbi:DUF5667 domain-containing protein [Streptomyces chromofuscus]|uniref:DUF5667 domain-containing protein n=1 Tax=Streptomyces chromofuscus TaxID=42881 RepID=A0A7M2T0Z1_STRCW|nr:DUF5667 domain-containing protein [Streptomyces chromofuscus]QOV42246.1 hypothetical protein IPT68_20625 [Streptomyces chromofuscus]GGT45949.1 hypothetical protein GCM10010254_75790 [Streptomyces chromofuscus]
MIANVSAHRRANAFAQALEEQSDRGTEAEQSEESAPAAADQPIEQGRLLAIAAGLGALPGPTLDPEVKVVQRAQLVAQFEAMFQGGGEAASDPAVPEQRSARGRGAHRATPLGKFRPRTRLAKGLTAGGLSVGVAASALGGVAAASGDALPGDSLYGLKRGIEDFKRGLADGDDERGQMYLDQASTRLSEARRLMERGRSGPLDHESLGEIRRALSGVTHDASEGHRLLTAAYERDPDSLGPIQALSAFSRSHRDAWGALRERLPVQLGDVSEQVSSVFDAIDQEVAPLQSLLPQPPTQGGGSEDGKRRGPDGGPDTGATESGRGSAAPSTGSGSSDDGDPGTGSPSRSAGTDDESDGLLGGTSGGLLDPPEDIGSASPSPSKPPTTEPDVTVPPLLPGLLPGLGLDAE